MADVEKAGAPAASAAAAPSAAPPAKDPAAASAPAAAAATKDDAAAKPAKPTMSSEHISAVSYCREFLRAVNAANQAKDSALTIVNSLKQGTTLGTGTFGRVRLSKLADEAASMVPAELLSDPRATLKGALPKHFALKIMKKHEVVRLKQVEHIRNEKEILQSINHPFLVTLYAVAQDQKNLYMLLEFIIGGELFTHLRKAGKFENEHGRFYAAQITLGLQYLHEEADGCIVYRDLKPENLLIDKHGYIKVTDFGFAKRIEDRTWTLCGTPEYLAPEIIQSKGHGKAVDWWAVGVLIYEMLAGYPPFYDENPFGIYQLILAGKIEFPRFVETHARDLVRKLLTADRAKRLGNLRGGGDDVRKHKWFRGLDFMKLFHRQLEAPFVPVTQGEADTRQFEQYPDSDGGSAEPLAKDVDADLFGTF